jgi:hypothetical protein
MDQSTSEVGVICVKWKRLFRCERRVIFLTDHDSIKQPRDDVFVSLIHSLSHSRDELLCVRQFQRMQVVLQGSQRPKMSFHYQVSDSLTYTHQRNVIHGYFLPPPRSFNKAVLFAMAHGCSYGINQQRSQRKCRNDYLRGTVDPSTEDPSAFSHR